WVRVPSKSNAAIGVLDTDLKLAGSTVLRADPERIDMLKEFREFLLEGDLIEIAVGLIIALKVADVVDSLTNNIINPIIGAVFGEPDFGHLTLTIGDGVIQYGNFINSVISFVLVGLILFLIVKAYNEAKRRMSKPGEEDEETTEDVLLLREIRDSLQRG